MVPKTCSIADCGRKHKARGLCDTHYRRELKGHTPRKPEAPAESRFWSRVVQGEGCWDWTGAKSPAGHGNMKVDGRVVGIHRFSYELAYGPITSGYVIDHICHTPSCANPKHLRAVTQKQNMENRRGAHSHSRSGVRGVSKTKSGKWQAAVTNNSRRVHVGTFPTLAEAEAAAIRKRNELFTCNDADRKDATE